MLVEDTIAGEHAKDTLEVLGVAGVGREEALQNLGSREQGIGATLPDGVNNIQPHDGV